MDKFVPKEFETTKYLTGLRAYAALAVFIVHSNGLGLSEITFHNHFFNLLISNGKYGVVIFFALSAYTLAMSLERNPDLSFKQYLSRRFLRVLPMYYAAIIVAFFFGGIQGYFDMYGVTNSWYNLFAHVSFINLFQAEYRNNLLGVEWSIPVEVFYYLLIPFMYKVIKKYSLKNAGTFFLFVIISIVGAKLLRRQLLTNMADLAYHWSVFKYFFCFSFGLFLFHLNSVYKHRLSKFNSFYLVGLIMALIWFIRSEKIRHDEFYTFWICAVIIVAQGRSILSRILFENRIVMFLGTISYSFYLVHYPIITLVRNFTPNNTAAGWFSLGLAIGCSYLTYQYIEVPFLSAQKYFSRDYIKSKLGRKAQEDLITANESF